MLRENIIGNREEVEMTASELGDSDEQMARQMANRESHQSRRNVGLESRDKET